MSFRRALLLMMLSPALVPGRAFADAKVGVRYETFTPSEHYNWRGSSNHGLAVELWYPADAAAVATDDWIGPPKKSLFNVGRVAKGAKMAAAPATFPLILLSHGTGGSAPMLAWLGTALAAHGYIAVAVNHPGNNALEPYTLQGFASWWERAHDLSFVLDNLLADRELAPRIDRNRIGAAGFSLGGYTMIALAGGITDRAAYEAFCKSARADGMCKSPPELTQAGIKVEDIDAVAKKDPDFAASLARSNASYRDTRIRAVFAIAPALGPAFDATSVAAIRVPVAIVAGSADSIVPPASSARWLADNIPKAHLTLIPGADHYVFLAECSAAAKKTLPQFCADTRGINRVAVHNKTIKLALDFFADTLR
jgi:predicted dienelactone hydrolase